MARFIFAHLLFCLLLVKGFAQSDIKHNSSAQFAKHIEPGGFIKNSGQFTNERNEAVRDVFYGTHIGSCGIFITNKGLSYINYKVKGQQTALAASQGGLSDSVPDYNYDLERIDITLIGAAIDTAGAQEIIDRQNNASYNYYTPFNQKGFTGIHSCKEIIFKNVYTGIDWSIQIVNNGSGKESIKYNFIVHEGRDVNKIKLRYSKNVQLSTNRKGDLLARSVLSDFIEKAPVSFTEETHTPVLFGYHVNGHTVSFEGKKKRFDKTVVIDPEVFWATYLPSTQADIINLSIRGADITSDLHSNIYVMINTDRSIPFITVNPGNGAYYQDYASTRNAALILMKFTKDGQLLWSTYFTGKGQTKGAKMTADQDGNLYALGKIEGNYFLDTNEGNSDIPLKNNGGYFDKLGKDYFITKFTNSGALSWCSFIGGATTIAMDITSDDSGNLYITGHDASQGYPLVNPGDGAYMQKSTWLSHSVPFIMQFDVTNKLVWSTHMEGDEDDPVQRIEVDKKGNIFLASDMRSQQYPWLDAGGFFYTGFGFSIARFNRNRQLTWCTNIPGAFAFDITTDDDGNLYVASGRGTLRKFNEKTELAWTKQYPPERAYSYKRMKYNRTNKVIHIFGYMNDFTYDFPTKNTECGSSFFYSGKGGKYYSLTGPIFTTYTTDGDLQYCSLADWPADTYSNCNFIVDNEGNLIYFFFFLVSGSGFGDKIPTLKDPGNGAYFTNEVGLGGETPYLLKLINSELNATVTTNLSATCDCNNAVEIKPLCGKAPFKYQWSNGDTSANVMLCSGDYTLTVSDDNFLTKKLYISIPVPPSGVKSFNADLQDAKCEKKNGSISINDIHGGTVPYTFSINNQPFTSSDFYPNIDSGNYIVSVKDANGCIAKDTFSIKNIAGPSEIHTIVTPASCYKDDAEVTIDSVRGGTMPYFYSINQQPFSTSNMFKGLPASSSALLVKDAAGCSYSSNIVIPKSLPPDSIDLLIQADHCFSGAGSFSVTKIYGGSQPFSVSIDNQSYTSGFSINNLKTGNYNVYVKDSKGCLLTDKVVIDNLPPLEKVPYKIQNAICGSITGSLRIDSILNGYPPYLFSLDGQNFQSSSRFTNVPYGRYTLNTKDRYGCLTSDKIEIRFIKQYGIDIIPHDTSVCYGQKVPFSLKVENPAAVKTVKWSTGGTLHNTTFSAFANSPVSVKVTDEYGCIINDTAFTQVKACNTAEKCVMVPSAFSPNNDGYNDVIGPVLNGCLVKNLLFQIYNRWGQLIFETTDLNKKWDGKISNIDQPQGIYVFVCSFISNDNMPYTIKGTLALIK